MAVLVLAQHDNQVLDKATLHAVTAAGQLGYAGEKASHVRRTPSVVIEVPMALRPSTSVELIAIRVSVLKR